MTQSTWKDQPATDEWNSASNWTPEELPTEVARFEASGRTEIGFSATSDLDVGSIEFAEEASPYTFTFGPCTTPALTVSGQGINNSSGKQQSFIVAATSSGFNNPQLQFTNSATAGGEEIYYCAGPESEQGYGGGVICFHDKATAGSAQFKVWTGAGAPPEHNTVGGEVAFCDSTSAANAHFTIYGSLGADGDTFGNVVFHDNATAANGDFTNVGGTVSGGDGGNTQFYGNSSAAYGLFNNWGGTHEKANGGDVAFDATADGGHGFFHNYAAKAAGAYGGVTSFNNNPPHMNTQGASAGQGAYFNYGARDGELGGGGHLEFSARYGSPTGANANIVNYGSAIESKSSAGHTIFSINLPTQYYPTAGNANIWNHPAPSAQGAAGFTEFSVYGSGAGADVPTAGDATLFNLGAYEDKAVGGYTAFSGTSSAGSAKLVAYAGINGGYGGKIAFYGESSGGSSEIQLVGNGELDIGSHTGALSIGSLELSGGLISTQIGDNLTTLSVTGALKVSSDDSTEFSFWTKKGGGFAVNTPYTVLKSAALSTVDAGCFSGNAVEGAEPSFTIVGDELQVTFVQS